MVHFFRLTFGLIALNSESIHLKSVSGLKKDTLNISLESKFTSGSHALKAPLYCFRACVSLTQSCEHCSPFLKACVQYCPWPAVFSRSPSSDVGVHVVPGFTLLVTAPVDMLRAKYLQKSYIMFLKGNFKNRITESEEVRILSLLLHIANCPL